MTSNESDLYPEEILINLRTHKKDKTDSDRIVKIILFICAAVAIVFVFLIIINLFSIGGAFFAQVPLNDFLFGQLWYPEVGFFGALPLIAGTLLVTLGAMIIAIPLGIGCAIFIAELAPPRIKRILKSAIELLAGIPSVIYGFFGFYFLNELLTLIPGVTSGNTWLSGSLILAVMALPTIISVSEDAVESVPFEFKEASLGLGATKWQTISKVVVPAAMSGITAAIVLGLGRAIGETIAVLMITGNNAIIPEYITNMFEGIRTITAAIALELGESTDLHRYSLFALGILLFVILLVINSIANYILGRLKKKFQGKSKPSKMKKLIPEVLITFKSNVKRVFKKYKRIICISIVSLVSLYLFRDYFTFYYLENLALAPTFDTNLLIWRDSLIALGFLIFLCIITKSRFLKSLLLTFLMWVLISWTGLIISITILTVIHILFYLFNKLNSSKQQRIWYILVSSTAFIAVFVLIVLVGFILLRGFPKFIEPGFLTGEARSYTGGIAAAIIGTLTITGGAILVALPIGLLAGIYLSEYAKENVITRIIRAGIDNLNGTPSIVFGIFGYMFFIINLGWNVSFMAGMLTLALMVLPTIIRTSEEAVKAIPQSFREGSLALGASKWQSIYKVVLPSAVPGIITGVILSMGRAAGETAPIMFTAAANTTRNIWPDPDKSVMLLTFYLFILITEYPPIATEAQAAGTALALLAVVIFLFTIASLIRNHYYKKKLW